MRLTLSITFLEFAVRELSLSLSFKGGWVSHHFSSSTFYFLSVKKIKINTLIISTLLDL